MSSSLSMQMWPETLRSLAFGSISGTYAAIGTALLKPSRIYLIQNGTNVVLTFSLDGVNDHFVVQPSAGMIIDITANKTTTAGYSAIPEGTITYVKGAPASGTVYLSSFYGKN